MAWHEPQGYGGILGGNARELVVGDNSSGEHFRFCDTKEQNKEVDAMLECLVAVMWSRDAWI